VPTIQRFILVLFVVVPSWLFMGASPTTKTLGSAKAQQNDPLILWHMLDLGLAQVVEKKIQEWAKATGTAVRLESAFDLGEALLKLRSSGRFPDAVLAPLDIVHLHPHVPFAIVPPAWRAPQVTAGTQLTTASLDPTIAERIIPIFLGNHLMLVFNKKRVSAPVTKLEDLAEGSEDLALDLSSPYQVLPFVLGRNTTGPRTSAGPLPSPADLTPQHLAAGLGDLVALQQSKRIPWPCQHGCPTERLKKGQSGYAIMGDWAIPDLLQSLGDDLGLAPLPSWRGHQLVSPHMPWVLAFPAQRTAGMASERRRAHLAELAQLLQSFDTQWAASQATYRMVANSAARAQTLASKRPLITAVWQQYLQAVALPVSVDALFWSAMDQGMRQTLSGELQPQKAADLLRELLASQAYLPTSLTRDP
jgi:hypothetical protein